MRDFFTETGKLDNREIKRLILARAVELTKKIDPGFVEKIIDQFWFHDFYNSFVADKTYFDQLLKYLEKTGFEQFNCYDYYFFLFDNLTKKLDRPGLHRLALAFELQQSDRLKPDEFKRLISQLKLSGEKFGIEALKRNHLVKVDKVENVEYVIWEHHTLTEFLTAEYLLTKEYAVQEFEQLTVLKQEGVVAFKPSWSGVLRFLLESAQQKEILDWLLTFMKQFPDNFSDELGELITFIIDQADGETQTRIFNLTYSFYFERLTWLPIWTRNSLHKFIDKSAYKRIREDIKKWTNKTETFVRRGNAAAIIGGMLENNHSLINATEKKFWKNKLIKFIVKPDDDGNGVLQRHCLEALKTYKDEHIIQQLRPLNLLDAQDSLVRETFVELCFSTPNSQQATDVFIEGLKKGSDIYARHGLYLITEKRWLKYFLKKITEDEQFLKAFLNHESIFDKENGDRQLINRLKELKDKSSLKILKKLFFNFLKLEHFHYVEKSNFVKQICLMIGKLDQNFLFEILYEIKSVEQDKIFHRFFDFEEFIAVILTPENCEAYFKAIKDLPEQVKNRAEFAIYTAKRVNGKVGEKVYRMAVKLGKIKPTDAQRQPESWEKMELKRKQERLNQFLKLLGKKKMFFTNVFQYYLQSKDELNEFFKTNKGKNAKKRLIYLAANGVKKIEPIKFKVTIEDKTAKKFHWPVPASYFGDLLDVVNLFKPELIRQNRQRLIDFIPYAFSDDMGRIMEMVEKISDRDLKFVNRMMKNPKDDRRYLVPGTYIYLIGHYAKKGCKLFSTKEVLISFIDDPNLPDYEKRNSLENLELVIKKPDAKFKEYLIKLFKISKDDGLKKIANALLISLYKDEAAMDWRFNQLKQPIEFDKRKIEGMEHSVTKGERELDTLAFAKPLIELNEEKYLLKFFDLVDFSIDFIEKKKPMVEKNKFFEFQYYTWNILFAFIEKLKVNGSFNPLIYLKSFINKRVKKQNTNWIQNKFDNLKLEYTKSNSLYENIYKALDEFEQNNTYSLGQLAVFLFRAQLVETELKKLIITIDSFLELNKNKLPIFRKLSSKTKKWIEEKATLGVLSDSLNNYQGFNLNDLKKELSLFVDKRNEFQHKLFTRPYDIKKLANDSFKLIQHAKKSRQLIQTSLSKILSN